MPLLELNDVRAAYGRLEALHGINIRVETGEIVTIIGANGAGKTTTLNAICGIVRVTNGSILLEGEEIANRSTKDVVRLGLSQVPEGRKLFSELTVAENLEMGAYLRKKGQEMRMDLDYVYELFPRLKERRKQPAGSLSGGEQQMCAIGRAIMAKPRILLLDEPSLGLAPLLVKQIFEIIQRLQRGGATILLVEQNAKMALETAHRAYVMETGRLTMEGEAEDLLNDPSIQNAYLGGGE
ncbi:MAG: ABC transporter ATP-binding protein [Candidatus Poribacteria bacterium]|nr:ABC transporter ATP-binding protein [Candidatus Poribacteria bacterium]